MISPTPSQLDCLRVINELAAAQGGVPTLREIAAELDMCHSAVRCLIDGLAARGWVGRERGRPLGIAWYREPPPIAECDVELTDAGVQAVAVPAEARP